MVNRRVWGPTRPLMFKHRCWLASIWSDEGSDSSTRLVNIEMMHYIRIKKGVLKTKVCKSSYIICTFFEATSWRRWWEYKRPNLLICMPCSSKYSCHLRDKKDEVGREKLHFAMLTDKDGQLNKRDSDQHPSVAPTRPQINEPPRLWNATPTVAFHRCAEVGGGGAYDDTLTQNKMRLKAPAEGYEAAKCLSWNSSRQNYFRYELHCCCA